MTDIKSLTLAELQAQMEKIGEKKFRASQIYSWLHEKLAGSFDEMSNLPKSLRERLRAEYELTNLELLEVQTSKLDGTAKFLFRLFDGNVIESVLMRYHYGNSVCVSSQAGCRMGCRFCASTLNGLARNLRPSEILDQVYQIQKWSKERVRSVVVMGSGEPLDNYEALLRFIEILTAEGGLHISQRNVTVSTCGIVPMMRRLADEELQITLALSLHAPSQEKRLRLMPIAKRYTLPEVLDACRYYFEKTGRRVTFEYSLASGVNDAPEDARALASLLDGMNCHINLIPVNPVAERGLFGPERGKVLNFKEILEKSGKHVTIRREMGRDIDGACGQLRRRYLEK
ncbi:MAG: 23S rRNA (adenine(2503)-C(2))-methyltransferase RlmN [Lachnospiraceae bacterium]|nr:23S rRNA (adenine(2503)-C(2))-methyltransferase RlmN [Lachnospiraceae bacterium]